MKKAMLVLIPDYPQSAIYSERKPSGDSQVIEKVNMKRVTSIILSFCLVFLWKNTVGGAEQKFVNLVKNPSFETGQAVPEGWTGQEGAVWDTKYFRSGLRSLKIERDNDRTPVVWESEFYQSSGKNLLCSCWLKGKDITSPDVSFGPAVTIVFYDAGKNQIGIDNFTNLSELLTPRWGMIKHMRFDWTYFEKVVTPPPNSAYFKIRFEFSKTSGITWMDDLAVSEAEDAFAEKENTAAPFLLEVRTRNETTGSFNEWKYKSRGFVFQTGEPLIFNIRIPREVSAGVLKYRITDFVDNELDAGQVEVKDGGEYLSLRVKNAEKEVGKYLKLTLVLENAHKKIGYREVGFGIFPPYEITPVKWDSPFAVFAQQEGKDGLSEKLKFIKCTWLRTWLYWGLAQKTKDAPFDYSGAWVEEAFMERFVDRAIKYGYGFVNTICVNDTELPPWAVSPQGGLKDEKDLYNFTLDAARHFKGKVRYWQIGNEHPFVDEKDFRNYLVKLRAAVKGLKEGDPEVKIVANAFCGNASTPEGFQKIVDYGIMDLCDAADFHFYNEDTSGSAVQAMREILDKKYGKGTKEIWDTEEAPTRTMGLSRLEVASYLVKSYTSFLGHGGTRPFWIDFSFWYAETGMRSYEYIDFWDGDTFAPRLAAFAFYALADHLEGLKFERELFDLKKQSVGYLFSGDKKKVAVLWSKSETDNVSFATSSSRISVSDIFGGKYQILPREGIFCLGISDIPIFLSLNAADSLDVTGEVSPLKFKEKKIAVSGGEKKSLRISVANTGQKPDTFQVRFQVPGGWKMETVNDISLKPKEKKEITADLLVGTKPSQKIYNINAFLTAKEKTLSSATLRINLVPLYTLDISPVPTGEPTGNKIKISLKNNSANDIKGILLLYSTVTKNIRPETFREKVNLKAKTQKDLFFPCQIPVDFNYRYPLSAELLFENGDQVKLKRYTGFYYCQEMKKEIKIDGNLKEWAGFNPVVLDKEDNFWNYLALTPGIQDSLYKKFLSPWKGPSDLSAKFWTAWDRDNFYLAVEVTDDVHTHNASDWLLWTNDSVQFAIAPRDGVINSHYEYAFSQTPKGPQVLIGTTPPPCKSQEGKISENAKLAVKKIDGQYVYELVVPWRDFAPVVPEIGKTVGFGLIVNENDHKPADIPRGGSVSYLEWMGDLCNTKDEKLYGDLTFIK